MPAADLSKPRETDPEVIEAVSAFIVAVLPDNVYAVVPDINAPVTVERPANPEEVRLALKMLSEDMEANKLAAMVSNHLMAMTMQMAQQQQNQQIADRLKLK